MKVIEAIFGGNQIALMPQADSVANPYDPMYELLWSLYFSDVYDDVRNHAYAVFQSQELHDIDVHAIRNPTYRVVEFYARRLMPGRLPEALPIETENDRIVPHIHQLWRWSNMTVRKQVLSRQYPLLGDCFIKVAMREDGLRVFHQVIFPEDVTDFVSDERDNIVYIRLDVPIQVETEGRKRKRYHVEIWDAEDGSYRQWTTSTRHLSEERLGSPDVFESIESFGIDFVPFVHAKFRDIGDERGIGAVTLALRKIWEADLSATALHQRQFHYNKPDYVLEGDGRDTAGRSMPPPDIREGEEASGVVVSGETLYAIPSGWRLSQRVANIDYRSGLAILEAHMRELENDLPELGWYRLRELSNQISGRAVRMLMTDPIDSAMEARGNLEDAIARANMMGLSMMRNAGLITEDIGSFDEGDLEHSFAHRDIVPLNEHEQAETDHLETLADAIKVRDLGYTKRYVQDDRGVDEEDIEEMERQRELSGDRVGGELLRLFDSGGQ